MRGLRITRNHVVELDIDPDQFFSIGVPWLYQQLDERHRLLVDARSMDDWDTTFARVGDLQEVPLPAYVLGFDGVGCTNATLGVAETRASVRFGEAGLRPSNALPIIGFEMRISQRGAGVPWRAVVSLPDERDRPLEYLIGLLRDGEHAPSNDHPVHGDLREIGLGQFPAANAIIELLRCRGHDSFLISSSHFEMSLTRILPDIAVVRIDIDPCLSFMPGGAELEIEAMLSACAKPKSANAA